MTIARLDNEVFFKKAFTDRIVFKAFVKDIIGIDVEPTIIETEKTFVPKIGSIGFKYDIFADDPTNRVVIEIQKVEYDHNFDRFLHYHLQAITEQQRSSADYSVDRVVYTIVVMTSKYRIHQKTGEIVEDEVLISSLNPKNLKGYEKNLFGHNLVFLNPNYKDESTPDNYRDWLDLIYESIHNPENPTINTEKEGIKRAAELVQFENISPEEWEESKIETGKRKVLTLLVDEAKEAQMEENVLGLLNQGILSDKQIANAFNVSIDYILKIKNKTSN
jgi:PD-(D/E)XK nuclease family transposase